MNSSIEISEKVVQAKDIYPVLCNDDSLLIFELASKGIADSRMVLERYHLTKKRYYSRLKRLVKLGLVSKSGGMYKQTALGTIIYEQQVRALDRILAKKPSFDILDDLSRKNKPDDGLRSAISDLSREVLNDSDHAFLSYDFKVRNTQYSE